MTVPPECQPIADKIVDLEAEKRSLQEDLPGLTGGEKWSTLQDIAAINTKISDERRALDQCVLAHSPGYETEVVVFDLTGNSVPPYVGHLWQLAPPSPQTLRETRTVQGGRIAFVNGASFPGSSIGVSIHDNLGSIFPGALFRSGPLGALPPGSPTDPAGLIEIGVPATPPPILSATITAGLPALPMTVGVSGSFGMTSLTIATLTITLGTGSVTLAVGATTTLALGFFLGSITFPFVYTLTFAIVPSLNMNDVTEICVVAPSGPGTLTTPLGGLPALLLSVAAPSIEPTIRASVVTTVQTALNAAIVTTAASVVGQATLPPGVVVSMRRVVVAPGGIVFFPSLGAYGGLLNKLPFP
jgi:hypothetical protein